MIWRFDAQVVEGRYCSILKSYVIKYGLKKQIIETTEVRVAHIMRALFDRIAEPKSYYLVRH